MQQQMRTQAGPAPVMEAESQRQIQQVGAQLQNAAPGSPQYQALMQQMNVLQAPYQQQSDAFNAKVQAAQARNPQFQRLQQQMQRYNRQHPTQQSMQQGNKPVNLAQFMPQKGLQVMGNPTSTPVGGSMGIMGGPQFNAPQQAPAPTPQPLQQQIAQAGRAR